MNLNDLASIVSGQLIQGDPHTQDTQTFQSVSIDSRSLKAGELFVAIKGPHFDGHQFIEAIQQQGAVAALVNHPIKTNTNFPLIQVTNTLQALGLLAKYWRQALSLPVIGITGSCGKTTTKMLVANILQTCGETLATEGTLNNEIGVPLTLLKLKPSHRFAVIEMGANHPGEIAYVSHLVGADIAIITNVGPVHLEGFGSLEGVAKAKAEIYQALSPAGIAIVNADEVFVPYWQQIIENRKIVTFGINTEADIKAMQITMDAGHRPHFILKTPNGEVPVQLQLMGHHNISNALAAAAAAYALDIPLDKIQQGLQNAQAVTKRLVESVGSFGGLIIDDSYNANPASIRVALEVLVSKPGAKVFAMGDMLELGENAADYHAQIGHYARQLGIDQFYGYGELVKFATDAFGASGKYFTDKEMLIADLKKNLQADMTVLVKGSKAMGMGQVVDALKK
jgi:UDP-N-acetylmuramoyl-tripeptide--D-alanyl-D-alanine ligase